MALKHFIPQKAHLIVYNVANDSNYKILEKKTRQSSRLISVKQVLNNIQH